MDLDIVIIEAIIVMTTLLPYGWGLYFFCGGMDAIFNFDEEYDDAKKYRRAVFDAIHGTAILLISAVFFWLVTYPFVVKVNSLNLPTFSWSLV